MGRENYPWIVDLAVHPKDSTETLAKITAYRLVNHLPRRRGPSIEIFEDDSTALHILMGAKGRTPEKAAQKVTDTVDRAIGKAGLDGVKLGETTVFPNDPEFQSLRELISSTQDATTLSRKDAEIVSLPDPEEN